MPNRRLLSNLEIDYRVKFKLSGNGGETNPLLGVFRPTRVPLKPLQPPEVRQSL